MPRGQRDNDNGSESQEGGTYETIKDEGYHFVHVQQHDKAIESFTKVIGGGWGVHCFRTMWS